MLITHNMGVVADLADRVVVMYEGKVVEQATATKLFGSPQHPYTQRLLASLPVPDPAEQAVRREELRALTRGVQ